MIQRLLLALALMIALLPGLPLAGAAGGIGVARAQSLAPGTPVSAISVSADTATADFPNGITFDVTATSPVPIVSAELFFHAAATETLSLGTAELEPGEEISASYTADFRGGQMPPGVDILYFWRLTDADGGVLDTPETAVLWADSRYNWQALEGENVTVYAYNDDPAFNQTILDAAERTIARLSETYGAQMPNPIRIWAYSSGQDFAGALAPNSEPWIAGAAYPALGLILSILPDGDQGEVGRIVPHEVSHQVLYQATQNPWNSPPVWFDEGLAVVAQEGGSENFPAIVQQAAESGQLESIRVLNSNFPYDAQGALLGYAQSESIVRFIQSTYGDEGIARLLAIFRQGVSYDEAVEGALGVTLDELNTQWQESLGIDPNNPGAGIIGGDDQGIGGTLDGLLAIADSIVMSGMGLLALAVGVVTMLRARRRRRQLDADALLDDADDTGRGPWTAPVTGLPG